MMQISPPVPVNALFDLVDFGKVRWDLATEIIATWAGELGQFIIER